MFPNGKKKAESARAHRNGEIRQEAEELARQMVSAQILYEQGRLRLKAIYSDGYELSAESQFHTSWEALQWRCPESVSYGPPASIPRPVDILQALEPEPKPSRSFFARLKARIGK